MTLSDRHLYIVIYVEDKEKLANSFPIEFFTEATIGMRVIGCVI